MPTKFTGHFTMQKFSGIRMTYHGNVILSCSKRTAEENFEVAKKALCLITDTPEEVLFGIPEGEKTCLFENDYGKVEMYREYA